MVIKLAVKENIGDIFDLRNDYEVRMNSNNTEEIKFENHVKWYLKAIEDENKLILVIKTNDIIDDFIGYIRFDLNIFDAIISIAIKSEYRNKGLSKIILEKGIEYFKNYIKVIKRKELNRIIAEIKDFNIPSIKLFEGCGFKFLCLKNIENNEILKIYSFILKGE